MSDLFLLSSTYLSQENIQLSNTSKSIECVELTSGEYFSDVSKNFSDYQTLYLNLDQGKLIIMNGEAFGVPQNSKDDIVIFIGGLLPSQYALKLIVENKTFPILNNVLNTVSVSNGNAIIALFDENNKQISQVVLK